MADAPALGRARAYGLLSWMWIRSSMAYRTSFVILLTSSFAITFLDFAAILIMFANVDRLGGFSVSEVAFLYGSTSLALGFADLFGGSLDRVGARVRDGSLDAMLLRPVPTLVQVMADQFAIRRLGRVLQAGLVFGWALATADIGWTWDRVLLVPAMLVFGTAIFLAILVLAGAFQVLATDTAEVGSAFTYGGNTMLQYPLTIFPTEVVRAVTFVVPVAFVNWYPALHVLDRADPLGLPDWVQLASPVAAAVMCGVAAVCWRGALRRYRSTGS
ncbi:MAG: ABC transporter permease [Nocardioidaceae bacterium]